LDVAVAEASLKVEQRMIGASVAKGRSRRSCRQRSMLLTRRKGRLCFELSDGSWVAAQHGVLPLDVTPAVLTIARLRGLRC